MQRLQLRDLDEDEQRLIGPYLTSGPSSEHEYRGFCVTCEDPKTSKTPSAGYNFRRGQWNCLKGDHGGSISALMRDLLKGEREAEVIDIKTGKKRPDKPLPTEKDIQAFVKQLQANERMMRYLVEDRGLSEETIERFNIGWHASRKKFVLPIYDENGALVNVRVYDKTAKGNAPKMIHYTSGYGTQLYGLDSLQANDDIVLCEGEWDRIVNEQNGIPTVTHTGGVNGFQMEWAKHFKGKRVWICFDEDAQGAAGAVKVARILDGIAAAVYIIPGLDTGLKGGDITDFYVQLGGTEERFREYMEKATETPFSLADDVHDIPTKGIAVSLAESQNADYREPIEVNVLVVGIGNHYTVPKTINATCDQNKGKVCAMCPLMAHDGARRITTNPDDTTLLRFIDAPETRAKALLAEQAGARCRDVSYGIESEWNVQELVVTQSLEDRGEEVQTPLHRPAYNIGYQAEVNTLVRLVGRQVAHWQNQRAVLHTWHMERKQSNIDDFELTPDQVEALKIFQRSVGQRPLDKCKEIARDLSDNITRIYGREQLHVAYDLIWHSIQAFKVQGRPVTKGWLEGIVIGDTRTGKSETAARMLDHYKAGMMVSCESATYSGLVGGAHQTPSGKGWMVKWGVIPLNDRRLVVLDEMSGMLKNGAHDKGMIEQMSSIRSSGRAEVTKIVSQETSARTRLVWISNPVGGRPFSQLAGGGVQALRAMIKNPEDIARFDFALAAAGSDVPSSLINSMHHDSVPHVYTSDLCSLLVRWAWSRKSTHVKWLKGAEAILIEEAEALGHRYINNPPLIQVENIREKLARIAVAIAARTFSTTDGVHVRVGRAHIQDAVLFLDWVYGADAMGYQRSSTRAMRDRNIAEQKRGGIKTYIRKNRGMILALQSVVQSSHFRLKDLEEGGGSEMDPREVARLLLEAKMIRRLPDEPNLYAMEPTLIDIMKEIAQEEEESHA